MSRRASFQHAAEDHQPLINNPKRRSSQIPLRRASAAHDTITVDWQQSNHAAHPTFAPMNFDSQGNTIEHSYKQTEALPSVPKPYHSEKAYIHLPMNDAPASMDLSQFRISKRTQRNYERIIIIVLAATVTILLALGGKDTAKGVLLKSKVKLMKRKTLNSNVPLHSFRANLRNDRAYVTSFPYGGFTNQIIELFKLMHLAQRLDRTAIVSELKAEHHEGGNVPFSAFFDLETFGFNSNASIVEWDQVKLSDTPGTAKESLSCWGWRDESALERYNIKTSFWPPPGQLTVPSTLEMTMSFPAMEVLASQPDLQREWLQQTADKYYGGMDSAPPVPDEKVLCFENLFYVPSIKFVAGAVDQTYTIEEMSPEDPVWNKVGVHLRFNDKVNKIADELLRTTLGSSTKNFIAVHLRQGDFVALGRIGNEVAEMYDEGVRRIQGELKRLKKAGKKGLPVIFATDSHDPVFIGKLRSLGWLYIDHVDFATTPRFGGWYPGLLDSVILSRATGFVGTKQSTFSYVAARRVESWNDGVTTIVG